MLQNKFDGYKCSFAPTLICIACAYYSARHYLKLTTEAIIMLKSRAKTSDKLLIHWVVMEKCQ